MFNKYYNYLFYRLTIGPNNIQVSVVTFSTNSYNEFFLNAYHTKAAIDRALRNVSYSGGTTHTEKALQFVRQNRFGSIKLLFQLNPYRTTCV